MKTLYTALLVLHVFLGLSAVAGGTGALMDPGGESMGISTDILKKGPFQDFLIPGLFLLIVNGVGNLIGAVSAYRKYRYQAYISGVLGAVMMAWIVIQVYILEAVNFLHVLYFAAGLITAFLAFLLALRQRRFPLNLFFGHGKEMT